VGAAKGSSVGPSLGVPSPDFSSAIVASERAASLRRDLCSQRSGAQNQQGVERARYDCVSDAAIVAEFDQRGSLAKRLDDRADLATDKFVLRKITEKRDGAEEVAPEMSSFGAICHHRTQQVTKRGISSPLRTIQTVLTIARRPCRETVTSICQRSPKASLGSGVAASLAAAYSRRARKSEASARPMSRESRNTRALCLPRGCAEFKQ
jgi:hypothetical protein